MSLKNNNPVNNEGQGKSNGSGKMACHKGKDKGFGFLPLLGPATSIVIR